MKKDELTYKDILDYYNKIQTFAQSEIERVYKLFKTLIWIFTTVFTVGVAISAFVIGKSVSDIKDKYAQDLHKEFLKITNDLNIQVNSIKDTVIDRVENEFRKENITYLVEQKAKERVDIVADNLITKLVTQRIQPLESHLNTIENDTKKKLERLIFENYLLQMDNDSRFAFTKILNYSRDKAYEFHEEAKEKIDETLIEVNKSTRYPPTKWKDYNVDFTNLDVEKIKLLYFNEKKSERIYFLNDIVKAKISIDKLVQVLHGILTVEKSLYSSYRIGEIMVIILKNDVQPKDVQPYDFEKILEYMEL